MAVAEGWARWHAAPWPSRLPDRWAELAKGFPQREQFLADRPFRRLKYHDYYLCSKAPHESETVVIKRFGGERRTPDSFHDSEANEIVWLFGGSTMENLQTIDALTIANQTAIQLKKKGVSAAVHNFGTDAFQSSTELIKFHDLLRKVPKVSRPTVAVFYDGYNDSYLSFLFGAGRMQADLSRKIELVVERANVPLVQFAAVNWLANNSVLVQNHLYFSLLPPELFRGWVKDASRDNLQKAVETYVVNTRLIRASSREFEIDCLFVLQPLIVKKSQPTDFEQAFIDGIAPELVRFARHFYSEVAKGMSSEKDFVGLSQVLDEEEESHFFDLGHTGPLVGLKIGAAVGEAVLKRIGDES